MLRATVIIPAWNEEDRVASTVQAAQTIPGVRRVLVVDDGSTDATAAKAAEAGANVLSLPTNLGKGQALAAGIAAADDETDVYLLLDADLGACAGEAAALLEPVEKGEADMAVAQFARTGSGGLGLARNLARRGIWLLTGWLTESPLSGQRAVRRAVFDKVQIATGWGAEVGLTLDAIKQGFKVVEVPVHLQHRQTGRDWHGFLHRGRQFAAVLAVLWSRWRRWGYRCAAH